MVHPRKTPGGYTLRYAGNRVRLASCKNFQLSADGRLALQFGKMERDAFALDVGPALTPLRAFALALASAF